MIERTPEGWSILGNHIPGSCSVDVRRLGRIDVDVFDSINRCRGFWKEGSTVIDVGANIGCWSYPMAEAVGHLGKVISIEGDPETFECLKSNLSAFTHAQPLNGAAWDTAGTVLFYQNLGNRDSGTVAYSPSIKGDFIAVTVPSVRLDDLLLQDVSFIKLDIEGAEFHALKGAESLLETQRPVLFFETLEHAQNLFGNTLQEMYVWLSQKGYRITHPTEHDALCLP